MWYTNVGLVTDCSFRFIEIDVCLQESLFLDSCFYLLFWFRDFNENAGHFVYINRVFYILVRNFCCLLLLHLKEMQLIYMNSLRKFIYVNEKQGHILCDSN